MLTRRFVLAGLTASLALQTDWAHAQLRSEDAGKLNPFSQPGTGDFSWRAADVQPLRRVRMSAEDKRRKSLDLLLEGDLVSPESKERLRQKIMTQPHYTDRITPHSRSTRMTFANKDYSGIVVVGNVVAMTEAPGWRDKSTEKIGWQIKDDVRKQIIQYEQAKACENDFLIVTNFLGECVRDPAVCSRACLELQALQV